MTPNQSTTPKASVGQNSAELLSEFSTDDLNAELARREYVREELQRRIYRGELEATDADGVETMAMHS